MRQNGHLGLLARSARKLDVVKLDTRLAVPNFAELGSLGLRPQTRPLHRVAQGELHFDKACW